jgi:hypothetical protein
VVAAEAAVSRAGDTAIDMAYFTARDSEPATYCRRVVEAADVYVGIIGFLYGTTVRDDPEWSFTELEFNVATELGLPRLVFLLDEAAALPLPASQIIDLEHGDRQAAFRRRLREEADTTVAEVASPDELETRLYQGLMELGHAVGTAAEEPEAPGRPRVDDEHLDRAARALAEAALRQWRDEAAVRGLSRPQPLRVSWSATLRPAAHPAAVLDDRTLWGYTARMRLRGEMGGIVSDFRRLRRRQMLVLGEPGAGKSMLAILLSLGLLDQRGADDPVPVLLSMSSWQPRLEHLQSWMAGRIAEDYPFLSRATALGLVSRRCLLPVLDGLDELPAEMHAAAIDELDRAIAGGAPFVATCRSSEYQLAVEQSGRILSTAVVIELDPVAIDDAAAFLVAAGPSAEARWQPVLVRLRAHPDLPLAWTLTSPLMVSLARTVYTEPVRDPAELLDQVRFEDQAAVERHLLNAYVPAAYLHPPATPLIRPASVDSLYEPEQARLWLGFLAHHLERLGTRDLAWWDLVLAVPRSARGLLAAVLMGLPFALAGALAGSLTHQAAGELASGLADGLAFGLAGGIAHGLCPRAGPFRVELRLRGAVRPFVRLFPVGLATGLGLGSPIEWRHWSQ